MKKKLFSVAISHYDNHKPIYHMKEQTLIAETEFHWTIQDEHGHPVVISKNKIEYAATKIEAYKAALKLYQWRINDAKGLASHYTHKLEFIRTIKEELLKD